MAKDTETYYKLIAAAAACFAEKGFNATSVREIATRAGISQGAMYTYFKSKDDLISAIVLEEQKTALNAQGETTTGRYVDRICSLVGACINNVGYPATHHLWVEIIAESARNPTLQQTFIASDKTMRQGIARIIEQGIAAGEFNPAINVEESTILLFAMIDGLIGRKAIDQTFSLQTHLTTFREVMGKILC